MEKSCAASALQTDCSADCMKIIEGSIYDQDGLRTGHNHEFMNDPWFQSAYERGLQAAGMDYRWHWRCHAGLWAAHCASKLEGDFVECGVAKGFLSSAIMHALEWDKTGRTFYLLDTFSGIDERYVSDAERLDGVMAKNQKQIDIGLYPTSPDAVIANLSEWNHIKIVIGSITETLNQITAVKIAYLHIDMNCAPPEWPRYRIFGTDFQTVLLYFWTTMHTMDIVSKN